MSDLALAIVIPTYREAANVPKLVALLEAALEGRAWEAIFVDDNSPDGTADVAREIARRAPPSDVISVLGPVEAPIAVVRGRHRWRLLVKAPRDVDLQGYLRAWAGTIPKLKSDVRVTVDIDPYNFL